MSPLPEDRFLSDIHRLTTQSSTGLSLTRDDLRSILSDGLLSFSPLATLVGADSARALAQRVTNFKQSVVVSLAPIGALGMMATVCKTSRMEGLKEMLGAGDDDIDDAARDLGYGTLLGAAAMTMDKHGGLATTVRSKDFHQTPCAIVRLNFETGSGAVEFNALRRVVTTFQYGVMATHVIFHLRSARDVDETIRMVQDIFSKGSADVDFDVLKALDSIKGCQAMVELHWPAPAMPLETHSLAVYLYGVFFVVAFLSIAVVATPAVLNWQSYLSSALLIGGQAILIFGHVLAQHLVRSRREILRVTIPRTGLGTHWMLIDKPKFTTSLARRPYSSSKFLRSHVVLSQCLKYKGRYASTWRVLATLVTLVVGFLAFYLGGKSSSVQTIGVYIGLFILANVTKGSVILFANKPHYTHIQGFGHKDDVRPEEGTSGSQEKSQQDSLEFKSGIDPADNDTSSEWTQAFPTGFRIYARYLLRARDATEIFCFANGDILFTAAQSIINARTKAQPRHGTEQSSSVLQMPVYSWHPGENGGQQQFHSLLIMAIDKIKIENLFYSVAMQIAMVLTDNYISHLLCPEDPRGTDFSILTAVVYSVTRTLVSEQVYCGHGKFPIPVLGVTSLLRSVAELRNTRSQYEQEPLIASQLNAVALSALGAAGTARNPRLQAKEILSKAAADREERLRQARALTSRASESVTSPTIHSTG